MVAVFAQVVDDQLDVVKKPLLCIRMPEPEALETEFLSNVLTTPPPRGQFGRSENPWRLYDGGMYAHCGRKLSYSARHRMRLVQV